MLGGDNEGFLWGLNKRDDLNLLSLLKVLVSQISKQRVGLGESVYHGLKKNQTPMDPEPTSGSGWIHGTDAKGNVMTYGWSLLLKPGWLMSCSCTGEKTSASSRGFVQMCSSPTQDYNNPAGTAAHFPMIIAAIRLRIISVWSAIEP